MKTLRAFAAIVALFTASAGFAFDLDPSEIRGKSSKEPVTVLQNRYFLKQYRPEVGFSLGMIMDEAYLDTQTYGVRTGFFMNEWFGVEVQMLKTAVSDSDDRRALNGLKYRPLDSNSGDATDANADDVTVSPDPEVNAIHGVTDFNAIAAPFYGKLNLMNKAIVYTDLYVTAGMSRVETDQGDKTAMTVGIGERFYIGKAWSVRVDFRDRIFTETRAGQETRKNCYGADLGASYFFN
jgi:outer membrane beta-barrel protein